MMSSLLIESVNTGVFLKADRKRMRTVTNLPTTGFVSETDSERFTTERPHEERTARGA